MHNPLVLQCPIRDEALAGSPPASPRPLTYAEVTTPPCTALVLTQGDLSAALPLPVTTESHDNTVATPVPCQTMPPFVRGRNHRHRNCPLTRIVWTLSEYPPLPRKDAANNLRLLSGLRWVQASTSKFPSTVRFHCGSHANCPAQARTREDPILSLYITEFSQDPHSEVDAEPHVYGLTPFQRAFVDQALTALCGQPALVRKRYLDAYWDGTEAGKALIPSQASIANRHRYLNRAHMQTVPVNLVQQAQILAHNMRLPDTAAAIEALPPTQAFVIKYAFHPVYGSVFVMSN
jgi:hypothetical protein